MVDVFNVYGRTCCCLDLTPAPSHCCTPQITLTLADFDADRELTVTASDAPRCNPDSVNLYPNATAEFACTFNPGYPITAFYFNAVDKLNSTVLVNFPFDTDATTDTHPTLVPEWYQVPLASAFSVVQDPLLMTAGDNTSPVHFLVSVRSDLHRVVQLHLPAVPLCVAVLPIATFPNPFTPRLSPHWNHLLLTQPKPTQPTTTGHSECLRCHLTQRNHQN